MHAVVVETDPDTAEIRVLRYCVVHDCGTLINPMIVEGQIHGGVAQGVGGALYERMEYAPDGQLLNASFMDFLMPYATEVPEIEIDHLVTPSPLNPLGVKGAGEAGVIPGSAAIAAAIEDAEGITITRMPISPSDLSPSLVAMRAEQPRNQPYPRGVRMKVTGTSTLAADPATVYAALNDPAVLVRTIPGCQRLEALGGDAYAMTVAAGVGSIKGVYDGQVRLADHQEPGSFTLHAQGAGAAGTIGAEVAVTLADAPDGGTSLSYDADAVVGGMIGGVGQRMLTGVSKTDGRRSSSPTWRRCSSLGGGRRPPRRRRGARTIRRFAPPAGTVHCRPAAVGPAGGPTGTVFTPPQGVAGGGPTFIQGVVVGAAAALAGALVGAWISRRAGRG